ncbi:hypothetical protein [Litchfieldella anticariensis]|uniref:hypothetical protein n=1 Tax=Litchfieldella anticariensis TaxID=258591 RepID=UPI000419DAA5|nr:hypothetical protein [Halomonas anticariensis]
MNKFLLDNYFKSKSLNYDISNPYWKQVDIYEKGQEGVIYWLFLTMKGLSRFFYKLLKTTRYGREDGVRESGNQVWFLLGSDNNREAIRKVYDELKRVGISSSLVSYNGYKSDGVISLPEMSLYIRAIFYLPIFLCLAYSRNVSNYKRKSFLSRVDRWAIGAVSVEYWINIFSKFRPTMIVISNDHSVWPRAALVAANKLNIKSVFIPHAPTGKNPADPLYDLAFLDGVVQYHMYKHKDDVTFLTGAIRYEDSILTYADQENSSTGGVLICFNRADSLERVRDILVKSSALVSHGYKVYVKPHPADTGRYGKIKSICDKNNIFFVDGKVRVSDLLEVIDVVVAGFSGVHLDATLAGKTSLTYETWYGEEDYYGFIENELIKCFSDYGSLVGHIISTVDLSSDKVRISTSSIKYNIHKKSPSVTPSDLASRILLHILCNSSEATMEEILFTYQDACRLPEVGVNCFTSKFYLGEVKNDAS